MERSNQTATSVDIKVKELIIKSLLGVHCKNESVNEDSWPRVSEMVGYYSGETLPPPTPMMQTSESESGGRLNSSIKRVVCSPDLPIPGFPGAPHAAAHPQVTATPYHPQQQPRHPQDVAASPTSALQCPVCQKTFTSKTAYQTHQRTHQAKDGSTASDDPYQCNICSKTFAVPARLTRHYRTHTGEKPFQCEYCNKSFSVKENLSVHRRIHTKERPYKCEVCARAFEHSGKLHRHMRIHTGERPHKCNVCNKTFIQSGQLVIHMRTHTGEKPYVCNVCSKGFTCSKQLKVHSRTHTGEKPYACDICGKSFGYNHVLKLHQVAHYGEKVYKCTICNDTFNSKKCMEAHIKSHSENAPSPAQSEPMDWNSHPSPKEGAARTNGAADQASSSESSCSSTSDKENMLLKDVIPKAEPPSISYDSDIRYYIASAYSSRTSPPPSLSYLHHQPQHHHQGGSLATTPSPSTTATYSPSSGVELLAAAASATERAHAEEALRSGSPSAPVEAVLNLISRSRHHAAYCPPVHYDSSLDHAGNEIRRRVEAALAVATSGSQPGGVSSGEEDPLLTPPSSNPVSPAPSLSPEPHTERCTLPMRKRSKMILRSMEASPAAIRQEAPTLPSPPPARHSSVIHYARASELPR